MALATVVFLATAGFTSPAQAATFTEGFEAGVPTTLFGNGATRDCSIGLNSSCSLKIFPSGTGEANAVHATTPVNLPMDGPTTVSFAFRGDTTYGDGDSNVVVYFDTGQWVLLHTTEGGNNQVSLLSQVVSGRQVFASWSAGAWHTMTLAFDAATDKVTATALGGSATMDIPPGAAAIDRVEFWGFRWSGFAFPVRYDNLTVQNSPVVVNTGPSSGLGEPAPGQILRYGGPHYFEVTGNDPQGDSYSTTVTIKDAAGAPVRTLRSGVLPDEQEVKLEAEPHLSPGTYTWSAQSVDSKGMAGAPSSTRTFTVDHGRYVALGDSFNSGEGVPPFESGTDIEGVNECHRSDKAYARLIVGSPGVPGPADFHACSGAQTSDFLTTKRWGEEPQKTHLGGDVSLLTLGVGGNDSGFATVLLHCATNIHCHEDDDDGIKVKYVDGTTGRVRAAVYVQDRFDKLEHGTMPAKDYGITHDDGTLNEKSTVGAVVRLTDLYDELQAAAEHAMVVVVGYPQFFSDRGAPLIGCWSMDSGERRWMNNRVSELNRIIQARKPASWRYADVEHALDGHRLCEDGEDDWMWGGVAPDGRYRFHPKAEGQEAFAAAVRAAIASTPAGRTKHTVAPQQTVSRPVNVGSGLPFAGFGLGWLGSDIVLSLRSPSGRLIDRSTVAPDVTRSTGPTYDWVRVENPEPGEWTALMYGADVPPDGEEATLDVTLPEPVNQEPIALATSSVARNTVTLDGSMSLDHDGSIVSYQWHFGDDTTADGPTATHTYAAPGSYTVMLFVTDDRGASAYTTIPVEIAPYEFGGFGAPINAEPTLNRVNAGRTIPLKWRIAETGVPVSDPASFGSVTSTEIPCDGSAPVDWVEELATSSSGLRYTGDGSWIYTWSTSQAWAGTCRRMTLRLADGAPGRTAVFDFR